MRALLAGADIQEMKKHLDDLRKRRAEARAASGKGQQQKDGKGQPNGEPPKFSEIKLDVPSILIGSLVFFHVF